MAFSVTGTYNPYVECEICLEPWHDPVELAPCDHIFCRQCIAKCWQCPDCRAEIAGKHVPSVVLSRIAARVAIRCDLCQWTGTRAEQTAHLSACPKGLGLAAAAFGGGASVHNNDNNTGADADVVIKRRQAANHNDKVRANVPLTPTQPNHADPSRPWRTYILTQRQFVRAANAFKDHATGAAPPMCLETVDAMQGFLNGTGLFGTAVTKRDAAIFFAEADINRVGAVPLHFALSFVGLNRPNDARVRRSYRYDAAADDDDFDDEEEEEEEENPAACVVGFGKEPKIAKSVAAMPDIDSIGGGGGGRSGGGAGAGASSHLGDLGGIGDFGIGDIDTGIGSRHAGGAGY